MIELKPHEQRMIKEARELTERIYKLEDFIGMSGEFDALRKADQDLMRSQHRDMESYLSVLNERIGRIFTAGG